MGPTSNALVDELSGDNFIGVEILGANYMLRKRFPRLKFLRLIQSDPTDALRLVFAPGDYERLEDMDMSEADLEVTIGAVSQALTGDPKG